MPVGSAPGERRGGRQKGTPNKSTVERAAKRLNARRSLENLLELVENGETGQLDVDALQMALVDAADGADSPNKALSERDLVPFTGNAHDLLRQTYQDPRVPRGVRLDAAKAAIKFETPALAATSVVTQQSDADAVRTRDTRRALSDAVALLVGAGATVTGNGVSITRALPSPDSTDTQAADIIEQLSGLDGS